MENSCVEVNTEGTGTVARGMYVLGDLTITGVNGSSPNSLHSVYVENAVDFGVKVDGNLTLNGSIVETSIAQGSSCCGINVSGDTTMTDSTVEVKNLHLGDNGSGVTVGGGLTLEGSILKAEDAGQNGISVGGDLSITGSDVRADDADQNGINVLGDLTVTDSVVNANDAGENGISVSGAMTVYDGSTVNANDAGENGISVSGTMTIAGGSTVNATEASQYAVYAKALLLQENSRLTATSTGSNSNNYGIYVINDLTMEDSHVEAASASFHAIEARNVQIHGGSISASAPVSGAAIHSRTDLSVSGATVMASAANGAAVSAGSQMTIDDSAVTASAAGANSIGMAANGAMIVRGASSVTAAAEGEGSIGISSQTLRLEDRADLEASAAYLAVRLSRPAVVTDKGRILAGRYAPAQSLQPYRDGMTYAKVIPYTAPPLPETGDASMLGVWAFLMAAALSVLALRARRRA